MVAAITFIYTNNLEQSAGWYETLLGLELALDQGVCRIYRWADGFLGLCRKVEPVLATDDLILTFVTDEVDAVYKRLQAGGATLLTTPTRNADFDIYHFFARDPSGYRVEVQKFLSPEARDIFHSLSS